MKNVWEMIKRHYTDHKAVLVADNAACTIIDWQNRNGSSCYMIRYIMDKQLGNLTITGDMGSAVFSWHNALSVKKFYDICKNCRFDVGYFASKIECTTDRYTYRDENLLEDVEKLEDLLVEVIGEDEGRKKSKEILHILGDTDLASEKYPVELDEIMENLNYDYDITWTDYEDHRIGRRIADRIYYWAEGFRMAYEQLYPENDLKIDFGDAGYLYFPTAAKTCREAIKEIEKACLGNFIIDNLCPTGYVLRNKVGEDIDQMDMDKED